MPAAMLAMRRFLIGSPSLVAQPGWLPSVLDVVDGHEP
jgi:hypothetical protein